MYVDGKRIEEERGEIDNIGNGNRMRLVIMMELGWGDEMLVGMELRLGLEGELRWGMKKIRRRWDEDEYTSDEDSMVGGWYENNGDVNGDAIEYFFGWMGKENGKRRGL